MITDHLAPHIPKFLTLPHSMYYLSCRPGSLHTSDTRFGLPDTKRGLKANTPAGEKNKSPEPGDSPHTWDSLPLPQCNTCKIPMRESTEPVTSCNGMHVFSLMHVSFAQCTSWGRVSGTQTRHSYHQRKRSRCQVIRTLTTKQSSRTRVTRVVIQKKWHSGTLAKSC